MLSRMPAAPPKDLDKLKRESRDALEETRAAREQTADREAQTKHALQVSAIVAAFCVLLNVGFFFLSTVYFNDKNASAGLLGTTYDAAHINGVRLSFALFSGIVTVAAIGAVFAPKWIGHGLSVIAGLAALLAAYFAFQKEMPSSLPVSLVVVGLLYPVLVWRSLEGSRGAWSFLIAMCFTFGLVLLFGAPKVRAQVGVGLWTALIIPGVLTVAAIALTMLRREYRDKV
jgi:hypothetical protein